MTSTLEGKPAGTLVAICRVCKGDSFKLLARAPSGAKVGEHYPTGQYHIEVAECLSCGEHCAPFVKPLPAVHAGPCRTASFDMRRPSKPDYADSIEVIARRRSLTERLQAAWWILFSNWGAG